MASDPRSHNKLRCHKGCGWVLHIVFQGEPQQMEASLTRALEMGLMVKHHTQAMQCVGKRKPALLLERGSSGPCGHCLGWSLLGHLGAR